MNRTLNRTEPSFYSKLQPHLPHITLWIIIFTFLIWLGMMGMAEHAVWAI